MSLIGPGTLIAGRYAVSHRIQAHPRWERWAAEDLTLGRAVVVLTFPADTPAAAAAVDAARRAAGVAEARLVRVLDVVVPTPNDEASPNAVAVVEEPVERAQTLTRILGQGGLPGEEARRITGEAATALDAAAARGLRHLVLTPRNVLILPDGSIQVRGVAVEAALLGLEDTPAAVASRLDARALVAIGYAALTGRWPLAGPDSGLPRAPLVGGVVVAPDELAADVCPDVDRLARVTLVEGAGPITPGEVRADLRPWPSGPTIDLTGERSGSVARSAPAGSAPPGTAASPTSMVASVRAQPGTQADPTVAAEVKPVAGQGFSSTPRDETSAAGAGPATLAEAGATASAAVQRGIRGLGSALGAAGAATAAASARLGERARHTAQQVANRSRTGPTDEPVDPAPTPEVSGNTQGVDPVAAPTRSSGGRGSGEVPRRPARPDRPDRAHRPVRQPETYLVDASLATVLAGGQAQAPLDGPVPLAPDPGEIGRQESRLALLIVGGLVLLLAVLGVWGLPRLSVPPAPTSARPSATTTATGTASAGTAGAAGTAGGGSSAAALVAVPIVGGATFDPAAGQVTSSSAARAFDGKPDTMWRSGWYSTAKFGGLNVPGIGLVVDLGQPTEVRRITVTLPVAQDITVLLANRASLDGATTIGSSTGRTGQLDFEVPAGPVTSGQLVIVFVTTLGPDGSGKFRAQVAEVSVKR